MNIVTGEVVLRRATSGVATAIAAPPGAVIGVANAETGADEVA